MARIDSSARAQKSAVITSISPRAGWVNTVLLLLPVVLPLALSIWTGLLGIDLGQHWDEPYNMRYVANAIRSHVLLPRYYNYPSMMFWLIIASLAPTIPGAMRAESFSLIEYVQSEPFLLQARVVFLIVSALAILWVYLTVLTWRKSWKEALLSAAVLGLSWELNYHIRWVTPDGIMAQFAALTLLFLVLAVCQPAHQRTWLRLAAVAAGLTTGSKYTAGLLLLPLFITLAITWDRESWLRGILIPMVELGFIMGLTYLITTPGTVLDPINFLDALRMQQRIYSAGHEVHTVAAGGEHLIRNLRYFSLALFSPFAPIALIFFMLAMIGGYTIAREHRRMAGILLIFPILYVLYFSMQRAMIIRNQLIVFPFIAILVGRGAYSLIERIPSRFGRSSAEGVLATLLLINTVWLFYAADTIRDRGSDRFVREFAQYMNQHTDRTFYVSEAVAASLADIASADRSNITHGSLENADFAAFYAFEETRHCIPANHPDLIVRWYGPMEVNWSYYTTWPGEERIVIIRADRVQPYVGCLLD